MAGLSEHMAGDPWHLLYLGAVAAALTAIYTLFRWVWPKMLRVHRKWQWFLSDESDHKMIMDILNQIRAKLEPNGGSHIPDQLRRIEDAVVFQGARQLAALHLNMNPVFESNSKGEVTFVNSAYRRFFGIDGKDALGMGWVNVINPEFRNEVVTKWFRAVTDKRAFDENVELIDSHGNPCRVHVIAHVIRSDEDKMLGHHGEITLNGEAHDDSRVRRYSQINQVSA